MIKPCKVCRLRTVFMLLTRTPKVLPTLSSALLYKNVPNSVPLFWYSSSFVFQHLLTPSTILSTLEAATCSSEDKVLRVKSNNYTEFKGNSALNFKIYIYNKISSICPFEILLIRSKVMQTTRPLINKKRFLALLFCFSYNWKLVFQVKATFAHIVEMLFTVQNNIKRILSGQCNTQPDDHIPLTYITFQPFSALLSMLILLAYT